MDIRYPATLIQEADGGFLVQFLDFEEAFTEGDTLEEALFNAAEVLTLTLDARMDEGIPIPEPSVVADAQAIAPSAKVQAALLIRRARGGSPLCRPRPCPGYLLASGQAPGGPAPLANPQATGASRRRPGQAVGLILRVRLLPPLERGSEIT